MDARYDTIRCRRETIEAGDARRSTLTLLHGFPSSSRMWERLIPTLAGHCHVVACRNKARRSFAAPRNRPSLAQTAPAAPWQSGGSRCPGGGYRTGGSTSPTATSSLPSGVSSFPSWTGQGTVPASTWRVDVPRRRRPCVQYLPHVRRHGVTLFAEVVQHASPSEVSGRIESGTTCVVSCVVFSAPDARDVAVVVDVVRRQPAIEETHLGVAARRSKDRCLRAGIVERAERVRCGVDGEGGDL